MSAVPDLSPEGLVAWCEKEILVWPNDSDSVYLRAIAERLRSGARPQVTPEALKPFADFMVRADRMGLPDETPLTAGSSLAQRQLTAGDFRALLASVAPGPSIREIREAVIYEAQGLVYEALGTARPPADGWSGFDARVAARLSRPAPQKEGAP